MIPTAAFNLHNRESPHQCFALKLRNPRCLPRTWRDNVAACEFETLFSS